MNETEAMQLRGLAKVLRWIARDEECQDDPELERAVLDLASGLQDVVGPGPITLMRKRCDIEGGARKIARKIARTMTDKSRARRVMDLCRELDVVMGALT